MSQGWRYQLAALLLLVGIVLSPLSAVAATIPMLIACDAAVRPTATTRDEPAPSLRPGEGCAPEYGYDAVRVGYDSAANPEVLDGAEAVRAYNTALEIVERHEGAEG